VYGETISCERNRGAAITQIAAERDGGEDR
jgi:hypothetical protein